MILTQSQTNCINHMLPGECVIFDGYRLMGREVEIIQRHLGVP